MRLRGEQAGFTGWMCRDPEPGAGGALRVRILAVLILCSLSLGPGCAVRRQLNLMALHPDSDFEIIPEDYALEPETLWVPSEGALIHAWLFHAPAPVATVVFCNGNSGNKEIFLPLVPRFLSAGYDVVLFDYRGFGLSTGTPNLYRLVDDAVGVVDAVISRSPDRPLALFGASLGAVVATGVARDRGAAVDALVLESTFSPREGCHRMLGGIRGACLCPLLVPGRWEVGRQLPRLSQPILMLHGTGDRISPLAEAGTLYRDLSERQGTQELWVAEGAGHSPGLLGKYGRQYVSRLEEFLEAYLTRRQPPPAAGVWRFLPGVRDSGGRGGDVGTKGVAEVAFPARRAIPGAGSPVEISVVYPDGTGATLHFWLDATASVVEMPVDSPPLALSARVVAFPVRREGDGWVLEGPAAERRIGDLQQGLQEAIGSEFSPFTLLTYGRPRRLPGNRIAWEPFVVTADERRSKGETLRTLEVEARQAAASATERGELARMADLLARLAAAQQLYGFPDEARDLYATSLETLPDSPEALVIYGDGSWQIGFDGSVRPALNELIDLARSPDERSRWVGRLGEWVHRGEARRARLLQWRTREEATAPPPAETRQKLEGGRDIQPVPREAVSD
jgi:hypothetical protein